MNPGSRKTTESSGKLLNFQCKRYISRSKYYWINDFSTVLNVLRSFKDYNKNSKHLWNKNNNRLLIS